MQMSGVSFFHNTNNKLMELILFCRISLSSCMNVAGDGRNTYENKNVNR